MKRPYYILDEDGKTPMMCANDLKWCQWFATHKDERVVAQTEVDNVRVATVFLGIDYGHGYGFPLLWETTVFGGGVHDGLCERYSSYDDAVKGHEEIVKRVKTSL